MARTVCPKCQHSFTPTVATLVVAGVSNGRAPRLEEAWRLIRYYLELMHPEAVPAQNLGKAINLDVDISDNALRTIYAAADNAGIVNRTYRVDGTHRKRLYLSLAAKP